MATGEKLFRGIFSFISISITAILLNFPFVAAASTGLVNSNLDVSMHTGAATLSVPIEVPPGRNGIQPNLALTYNSYRGNGWIGVGWDLDMGSIQRSTKFGVNYSNKEFVANIGVSAAELVPRTEWGTGYYGAKIEGEFTKYYLNPSTGGWEVTDKDGTKYFYGSIVSSRQENSYGIFKWCLDRVEDTNGNFLRVTYTKDQGQIYLKLIEYTGNVGISPASSVKFHLNGSRPDKPKMYTTNAKVLTANLLDKIEVSSADGLVRTYTLKYSESGKTKRSLLAEIKDGESLLPIAFQYQNESSVFANYTKWGKNGGDIGAHRYKLGDFNGDGITDVVSFESNGGFYVWQSNGSSFDPYSRWGKNGGDIGLQRYQLGDFNGDGKTDVVSFESNGRFYVWLSNGRSFDYTGRWGQNGGDIGVQRYQLGDFNGDGKTDVVSFESNGRFYVWLSNGRSFDYTGRWGQNGGDIGSDRYQLGDFNGDGKTDVISFESNAGFYVWLSNGHGFDYTSRWGQNGGDIGSIRYKLGDFNGDGKTDVISFESNAGFYVWLSNGHGFDYTSRWGQNGGDIGADRYKLGDLNGDGKTDAISFEPNGAFYVWLSNGAGFDYTSRWGQNGGDIGADRYKLGDLNGDGKADAISFESDGGFYVWPVSGPASHLMSSITSGMGGKTTIHYSNSSQCEYSVLPFIAHPVSRIVLDDGLGNLSTTEYSYSGGLYDFSTREFRGFETVTQKAAVETAAEIWTVTKFHQDEYYKGRQYHVDLKEPGDSGALLSQATFLWGKTDIGPPENKSAFVKLLEKRTESYDGETIAGQEVYEYDDTNGNLLSTTASGPEAESVTTSFLYENFGGWLWRKTRETVEGSLSGKVRESYYGYEHGTGNLLYKEFWLDTDTGNNPRIAMTYDEYGNQETVTDARGNPTITEYDPVTHTYPVKITYPETNGISHVVENEEWDYRFGKVKVTKDENGNRTYYDYDEFGRLIQVDSPDGGQVVTEYYDDEFPRLVITRSLEDDSGSTIDNYQYFDGLGRQIQTIAFGEGGKSIVTRYYYDEMGRNDLVEGPFFAAGDGFPIEPPDRYPWTQTTFDKRGRPDAVENSDGEYGSVSTTFSYSGLSTTVNNPDGGSKTEKKDYLGRVVQVIEHAENGNYDTNYVYNVAGELLQVVDYYGNTTTINYDSLGRKLDMTDQDMGFWEYTYDGNGNLHTQTDQKQQRVTFDYDELNRILSKSYNASDPTVYYSYDNLNIDNGRGRLYSVSNSQVTTTYNAYDPMGRLKSVSKTIEGDGNAYTTQYVYDLSGKLKQTIYPDGYQVNHTFYPGSGLLEAVTGSDNVRYAHNTNYEPTSKIGLMEHGNGTYTRHTYDPESTRLKSIISSRAGPSADLQNKAYQYTAAGNIKQIADTVKGIYYNYTYDKLHRLKTETNTGSYDPISYEYDALGNIMSKTVGSSAMDYNYQGPRPHAVKSIRFNGTKHDYTYDANGNMTGGPDFTNPQQIANRTISYNADNMPQNISHTKSGKTVTTNFIYDGNGTRAKKQITGGSTTYYIGDHFEIKDGVATKFIFAGNLRVAKITGTGINYFHKDHLGSSSVISDNNGNAVETADYTPFGSLRDHTGSTLSNYKFTDQEFDPSSGLYNYNARLYDPIIGRFISPDPFVQAPFDPQTLNRYSYVRNNPLIYIDPSGYSWFSKAWKKVKKAVNKTVKKVAKAAVTVVTNEVLTYALFSVFDIAVPGLGQAISIGVGILSSYIADKAVNKLSGTNQGGGGGSTMPIYAGRGSPSGSSGGGYTGPLFPSGVSPGGGYSAISGTTYDFVRGYSANVVSNGHVFHGAFYQAIGKIYSGVTKAISEGAKGAAYSIKRAFYSDWVNNPTLRNGVIDGFVRAGKVAVLSHAYTAVHVGSIYALAISPTTYTSFMVWGGTPQGQKFLMGTVDFMNSALPGTPVNNRAGRAGFYFGNIYNELK